MEPLFSGRDFRGHGHGCTRNEILDIGNILRNNLPMEHTHDFVASVGLPLIAHRLRRVSDAIVREVGMLLEERGLAVPPRAASLMMLLLECGDVSVTSTARRLGLSHPMVINLARTLNQAGLVEDIVDYNDSRRRLLRLTAAGRKQAELLSGLNERVSCAFEEMFVEAGIDLFEALQGFERAQERRSLLERVFALYTICAA